MERQERNWSDPGGMLDFLFPPLCLGCGEYSESLSSVCPLCDRRIDRYHQPICLTCGLMIDAGESCSLCLDQSLMLYAFGNYADPMREIIVQFKFRGMTTPAKTIAKQIAGEFGERLAQHAPCTLVPVPLYHMREYARGYNQAQLFAAALSEELRWPMRDDLVMRTAGRREQAKLRHHERERNIRGVFELERDAGGDETIVLVDDVVTTGATVMELRRVLSAGGYRTAAIIAMAHGL